MRRIILNLRDDDPKMHVNEYEVDRINEYYDYNISGVPVKIMASITGETRQSQIFGQTFDGK